MHILEWGFRKASGFMLVTASPEKHLKESDFTSSSIHYGSFCKAWMFVGDINPCSAQSLRAVVTFRGREIVQRVTWSPLTLYRWIFSYLMFHYVDNLIL